MDLSSMRHGVGGMGGNMHVQATNYNINIAYVVCVPAFERRVYDGGDSLSELWSHHRSGNAAKSHVRGLGGRGGRLMDNTRRMTLREHQAQAAYIEQLRRALTIVVRRPGLPERTMQGAAQLCRPRTWQAIPGVSRLYSLN